MCQEESEMTEKGKIAFSAPRSDSPAMNHHAIINVVMSTTPRSTSINQLIMSRTSITTAFFAAAFEWKALPRRNVACQVSMTNATASCLIDFDKNRCRSARHSRNSCSNFVKTLRLISFAFDKKFHVKFNRILEQSLRSLIRLKTLFWAPVRSNLRRDRYLLRKLFLNLLEVRLGGMSKREISNALLFLNC